MEEMANEKSASADGYSLEHFKQINGTFQKLHAQAKDFVKFLTTLERQFKNISRGELPIIEETLPSLLNGLKLIWTISRHINQNEGKMEDLLESISNEICDKVRAKIDIKRIFRQKPDQAITTINEGINVLEQWQKKFHQTKMEIEAEATVKRWDFTKTKEIFIKPKHMKSILEDMKQVCTTLKEFYSLLGPDLKAVTGDADSIDEQKNKILTEVQKLESFVYDVFAPEHYEEWRELYKAFEDAMRQSDSSCVHLIDSSFNKLKSSEGAFDLLNKFKNIKTRKAIEDQLSNKYIDVLEGYKKEVA